VTISSLTRVEAARRRTRPGRMRQSPPVWDRGHRRRFPLWSWAEPDGQRSAPLMRTEGERHFRTARNSSITTVSRRARSGRFSFFRLRGRRALSRCLPIEAMTTPFLRRGRRLQGRPADAELVDRTTRTPRRAMPRCTKRAVGMRWRAMHKTCEPCSIPIWLARRRTAKREAGQRQSVSEAAAA